MFLCRCLWRVVLQSILGSGRATTHPPPPLVKKVPSLRERIRDCHPGRIPYSETVSIVLDVAEGLAYLHQLNLPIVH